MRKAYFYWGLQELPEVETLEEIEEDGLYAVAGWKTPVSVQTVTVFGEEQISAQYPKTRFFYGADGVRRCAMGTGSFKEFSIR